MAWLSHLIIGDLLILEFLQQGIFKEQAEEAGVNYFTFQMLFGTLSVKDAIRSVELFGNEVIPAFADSGMP